MGGRVATHPVNFGRTRTSLLEKEAKEDAAGARPSFAQRVGPGP